MKLKLIVVALVAAIVVEAKLIEYDDPVRTVREDEVKYLTDANQSENFKLFAGYLEAFDDGQRQEWLYYWFVQSQSSPATDPIVLWLNEGPGGSSLTGALSKMGPFRRMKDGLIVVDDKFSWNKMANMLFIEGPIVTGCSHSRDNLTSITDCLHDDNRIAAAKYLAIGSFMQKHPQYINNPLYLVGVSYASLYVPLLGEMVDKDPKLNLKGIAIGNGYFGGHLQSLTSVIWAYYHGLIGEDEWNRFSEKCCHNEPPSRESCIANTSKSEAESKKCLQYVFELKTNLGRKKNVNVCNIYQDEPGLCNRKVVPVAEGDLVSTFLGPIPTCWTMESDLVNLSRETFHILPEFVPQEEALYCRKYEDDLGLAANRTKNLIGSERNLTMLVFSGDADLTVDFLGSRWFIEGLGQKPEGNYSPWKVDGQLAGFVQQFDGITYATVLGGSHMVVDNRPREAFALIERFLDSVGSQTVQGL